MKRKCIAVSVALMLVLGVIPGASGREWTSSDGAKLAAEFVSSDGTEVTLKRDGDGKTFTLPLSRLSADDQTWIKDELAKAVAPGPAADPEPVTGQYAERITGQWDLSRFGKLPYAIYGSKDLDGAKKYPLLIALHGKSSNDTNGVQIPGWAKVFAEPDNYAKHPCIIVSPLCYQPFGGTGGGWNGEPPAIETLGLIKDLVKDLPIVDPERVYIFGYSMGGFGTSYMVSAEPKLFAAAISVAGCSPNLSAAFKRMPYQLFHAADDEVVDVERSRDMADKLKRNKQFKYTEYETGGHGIVSKVFDDAALRDWLFDQSKK